MKQESKNEGQRPVCAPPRYTTRPDEERGILGDATKSMNKLLFGWDDEMAEWAIEHYQWCSHCKCGTMRSTEGECSGILWDEYAKMLADGTASDEIDSRCDGRVA